MLNVAEYISPECTCNVEDMVAKLDHVSGVEFNPLTQVLKVTAHQGMINRGARARLLLFGGELIETCNLATRWRA